MLLAVNVLCTALIRFPWKRHQVGFVITHLGLLVLAGCLLGRAGGIDAQLSVFEDGLGRLAYMSRQHFHLKIADHPRDGDQSADTATGSSSSREVTLVDIPFVAGPFNWEDYGKLSWFPLDGKLYWFPWRLAHRDGGVLYDEDGIRLDVLDYYSDSELVQDAGEEGGSTVKPLAFNPKRKMVPTRWARRARVRLDVDGTSKELWLAEFVPGPVKYPARGDEKLVVESDRRRVTATLTRESVDPGVTVRLQSLIAGSTREPRSRPTFQPRRSARHVGFAQVIRENVLINMNEPVDVIDPVTGRSYRLYQESFPAALEGGRFCLRPTGQARKQTQPIVRVGPEHKIQSPRALNTPAASWWLPGSLPCSTCGPISSSGGPSELRVKRDLLTAQWRRFSLLPLLIAVVLLAAAAPADEPAAARLRLT